MIVGSYSTALFAVSSAPQFTTYQITVTNDSGTNKNATLYFWGGGDWSLCDTATLPTTGFVTKQIQCNNSDSNPAQKSLTITDYKDPSTMPDYKNGTIGKRESGDYGFDDQTTLKISYTNSKTATGAAKSGFAKTN